MKNKKNRTVPRFQKNRKIPAKITAAILVMALAAGLTGCQSTKGPKLSASTKQLAGAKERESGHDGENAADDSKLSLTDDFRRSYSDFAVRLLKESRVQEPTQNTMLSPLSAMMALEMTRSGAAGETESQMGEVLYGELESEEGRKQLLSYMQNLPAEEKARFHFANSIWFLDKESDFSPNEDFLKNAEKEYWADIYSAPFDESTLKDVNNWIEHETDGMIKDMLKEISPDAVMYLINALAFEGEWLKVYEKNQIHEAEFYPENGQAQTVEMMYGGEGEYLEDEEAVGFLKYYQGPYAFAALLPREGTDMDAYLNSLTGEKLTALFENVQHTAVDTGLPKFTAETSMPLNEVLKTMGMPLAFDEEQADFSGMGKAKGNIYIGRVLQNTFIEVDELGTRAGAATVVEMNAGAAMMERKEVILNRPFVYAIVDTENHLPIFLGVMEQAGE